MRCSHAPCVLRTCESWSLSSAITSFRPAETHYTRSGTATRRGEMMRMEPLVPVRRTSRRSRTERSPQLALNVAANERPIFNNTHADSGSTVPSNHRCRRLGGYGRWPQAVESMIATCCGRTRTTYLVRSAYPPRSGRRDSSLPCSVNDWALDRKDENFVVRDVALIRESPQLPELPQSTRCYLSCVEERTFADFAEPPEPAIRRRRRSPAGRRSSVGPQ